MHGKKRASSCDVLIKHPAPAVIELRSHLVRESRAMRQHAIDHLLMMSKRGNGLSRNVGVANGKLNV
jgi:hypothetical protein